MTSDVARNEPFDVDAFLSRPLVARLATIGPTVRPVWFLWEDGAFWWLTGSYARLGKILEEDPRVALVVDTCDLSNGEVLKVTAHGRAEVVPYDADRARRKLARYLGTNESSWDGRFSQVQRDQDSRFVRLIPERLTARNLSFSPSPPEREA